MLAVYTVENLRILYTVDDLVFNCKVECIVVEAAHFAASGSRFFYFCGTGYGFSSITKV